MAEQVLYELGMADAKFIKGLKNAEKALKTFDNTAERVTKDISTAFDGMIKPEKVEKRAKELTNILDSELKKQLRNVKGNIDAEERLIKAAAEKRVLITKQ